MAGWDRRNKKTCTQVNASNESFRGELREQSERRSVLLVLSIKFFFIWCLHSVYGQVWVERYSNLHVLKCFWTTTGAMSASFMLRAAWSARASPLAKHQHGGTKELAAHIKAQNKTRKESRPQHAGETAEEVPRRLARCKGRRRQRYSCLVHERSGFEKFGLECSGWNFSNPRKLSLHWNTTSPHRQVDRCKQQVCAHELHLRRRLTLLELDAGEDPVFDFYLDNQVDGKLTIGGVHGAHFTGGEPATGMLILDAYAIVDSVTNLLVGPSKDKDVKSSELVDHHLVQPRVHRQLNLPLAVPSTRSPRRIVSSSIWVTIPSTHSSASSLLAQVRLGLCSIPL